MTGRARDSGIGGDQPPEGDNGGDNHENLEPVEEAEGEQEAQVIDDAANGAGDEPSEPEDEGRTEIL